MFEFNFTINNYDNYTLKLLKSFFEKSANCVFMVVGKEVAPSTGTPHIQGYVQFKRSFKNSYNVFNDKVFGKSSSKCYASCTNIPKYSKATAEQIAGYCKKGIKDSRRGMNPGNELFYHTPHESWRGFQLGELQARGSQGQRNDLNELKDAIMEGWMTVDDILQENPSAHHQYGRTLNALQNIYNRKIQRTKKTTLKWIFGDTGVGKTYYWKKDYNPETDYCYQSNDGGFWCGYRGQKRVIINEFRGGIPFKDLLDMADDCPYFVKGDKGGHPIPFTSEEIIITSSMPPTLVYNNLADDDKIDQLLDRAELVWLRGENRRKNGHLEASKRLLAEFEASK